MGAAPQHISGYGVRNPHAAEQHRKLGDLRQPLPVRREETDDSGAEEQYAEDGQRYGEIGNSTTGALPLEREDILGALSGKKSALRPFGQIFPPDESVAPKSSAGSPDLKPNPAFIHRRKTNECIPPSPIR
jgi:hypothetical protein